MAEPLSLNRLLRLFETIGAEPQPIGVTWCGFCDYRGWVWEIGIDVASGFSGGMCPQCRAIIAWELGTKRP